MSIASCALLSEHSLSFCFGRRLFVVGFGFLLSSCRHVFIHIAFYTSILKKADADPAFLALGHSVWYFVCVCAFLIRTCRILLLDFTLFSYTFAASHITLCIVFRGQRHLEGCSCCSVAADVVNRFRMLFAFIVVGFVLVSYFCNASQLLRLYANRYHDVISRCILKKKFLVFKWQCREM